MSTEQTAIPSCPGKPRLWLELAVSDSVAVINIQGELGRNTSHLFTELVEHVARGRPSRVVLDLARVRFQGDEGLGAPHRARDMVTGCGATLVLAHSGPRVGDPLPRLTVGRQWTK